MLKVLESDFTDTSEGVSLSCEDQQFLGVMESNIYRDEENHYVMPLPFSEKAKLQNNRPVAEKRLSHLKSKFERDSKYRDEYSTFMSEMLEEQVC